MLMQFCCQKLEQFTANRVMQAFRSPFRANMPCDDNPGRRPQGVLALG